MILAKDYAAQYDPEGLAFDFNLLDQFAKSALKFYTEVAQTDGIVEKLEAQAKDRSDARLPGKNHETQSMRLRRTRRFAAALIAALSATGTPAMGLAQTRELALERIFNPMPDFDPFETAGQRTAVLPRCGRQTRPRTADRYVDQSRPSLGRSSNVFQKEDARLQREQRTSTGLTERAQDLVNNTIQDRETISGGATGGDQQRIVTGAKKISRIGPQPRRSLSV